MWMCQSRHDLVTVRNSTAVTVSENGSSTLRSLRFLRNDMNVTLRLPSESSDALTAEGYSPSRLMVCVAWTLEVQLKAGVTGGL